ncbi:MAG: hypothetical protein ACT4OY_06685 [Alphaproteobacteria bacterium]
MIILKHLPLQTALAQELLCEKTLNAEQIYKIVDRYCEKQQNAAKPSGNFYDIEGLREDLVDLTSQEIDEALEPLNPFCSQPENEPN